MVNGTLLGAAMLLGVASCTDDHFDIVNNTASGANTIWQNIESNEEMDSLAMILKRSKVMKKEMDLNASLTYAELLNTDQQFTVWAPLDGTYNAKQYIEQLDLAERLVQENAGKMPDAARRIYYNISNQFSRNHIARFGHDGVIGNHDVRMMNAKMVEYDPAAGLFNGVQLDASEGRNIISSNGMLHAILAESPFSYNVYDYLPAAQNLTRIAELIDTMTVETFSEEMSTQGAMNDEGKMEYIDSVWVRDCEVLTLAGATSIQNEDSCYLAVVPSDAAFEKAWNSIKDLYNYAPSYNYDWTTEGGGKWNNTGVNALRFNTDSLARYNAQVALLGSMFFSKSNVPGLTSESTPEEIVNAAINADSLKSTDYVIVYNPSFVPAEGDKPAEHGVNPMFGGMNAETCVKASNGYIFPVDDWVVGPEYGLVQRTELKMYSFNLANVTGCTSEYGESLFLDDESRNPEVTGEIEDDHYYYFPVSGNSALNVNVMLREVLSGRYKISVVMAPNRINIYNQNYDKDGDVIPESPLFDAQIIDDKGNTINKKVSNVSVNQDKVEKITLWEDFKFPYSYAGLPSGAITFPTLRLSMSYIQQVRGKCKALSIIAVILEPVRE